MMGADVTVFDISEENARYALELAAAAEVSIGFVVGDFLANAPRYIGHFDAAVMELGVLHYFVSVEDFAAALRAILRPGAAVVLTDFHPLLRKVFASDGDAAEPSGDYFSAAVERAAAPYASLLDREVPECRVRRWTLGEIVSACAASGFRIERLIEYPDQVRTHLPGTFTLTLTAD